MNISPRHVSRGIEFGKVLVRNKMVHRAIKVFDKTIDISRETLSTQEEISKFCFENEMYEYAIRLMRFIISISPTRSDIMIKLGKAYCKKLYGTGSQI
jgi:hypothetical protein